MYKEELKKFYQKYKLIIVPAVIGIVCIIILATLVIPQILGYFDQKDKIIQIQSRIDNLDSKASSLEALDEDALKNELELALTILPIDRDVPQAMADLQVMVAASNMVLKNTTYSSTSKTAKGGGKENFALTLNVSGSVSSLRSFINNLENVSRLYKVEAISVKFPKGDQIIDADIPLSVYFEKPTKSVVTLEEPIAKLTSDDATLLENLTKIAKKIEASPISTASAVPIGKSDPFN